MRSVFCIDSSTVMLLDTATLQEVSGEGLLTTLQSVLSHHI